MTKPDLREIILAYLRAAGVPVTSRELASRFLLIRQGDESICYRLLAPYLSGQPSLEYTDGEGWRYRPAGSTAPAGSPASAGSTASVESSASVGSPAPTASGAPAVDPEARGGASSSGSHPAPERGRADTSLRDFIALASEGGGPSGSGRIRAVSLQPVVGGEECNVEHLPAWAAEDGIDASGIAAMPDGRGKVARMQIVGLETAELQILAETVGDLPIVCHRVAREAGPLLQACAAVSLPFHPITISLAKLGHLLLDLKGRHAPSELAAALGLEMREPDDCRGRVRLMTHCFLALQPMLEEIGITTFDDLQTFQNQTSAPLDFSPYAFTMNELRAAPARPGVYRFYDREGGILYIGKAKNLRSRLSSYFVPSARGTDRGRAILERVYSFSFEVVSSELEALLTEAALLSELRPPLNRQFDVHERPAPYGSRLNLAVVLPEGSAGDGASPEACTVHLMHEGRYRRRIRGVCSPPVESGEARDRWHQLDAAVRAVYFQSRGKDGDAGAIDWQLVASYLARHRDEVNVLDIDECDSPESALSRLEVLAVATVNGERVVVR